MAAPRPGPIIIGVTPAPAPARSTPGWAYLLGLLLTAVLGFQVFAHFHAASTPTPSGASDPAVVRLGGDLGRSALAEMATALDRGDTPKTSQDWMTANRAAFDAGMRKAMAPTASELKTRFGDPSASALSAADAARLKQFGHDLAVGIRGGK